MRGYCVLQNGVGTACPYHNANVYSLLLKDIQGTNSKYKNVAHSVCPIVSEAPPRPGNPVLAYVSKTAGLAGVCRR